MNRREFLQVTPVAALPGVPKIVNDVFDGLEGVLKFFISRNVENAARKLKKSIIDLPSVANVDTEIKDKDVTVEIWYAGQSNKPLTQLLHEYYNLVKDYYLIEDMIIEINLSIFSVRFIVKREWMEQYINEEITWDELLNKIQDQY